MKTYIFKRVLRSLLSIFLVTTLIYAIIFTMVPRRYIFKLDATYQKMVSKPDEKIKYENTAYEKIGYIGYWDSKELMKKARSYDSSVTVDVTDENKAIYEAYIASVGKGWTLHQLPESGAFYATREIPIYERVLSFYANLIQIDHPWKIQDASNPDLERYIRVENDPSIGWSVVGSGTKHKYLLYVNSQFPYIHQNFITLNLGVSYPTYQNIPVLQVVTQGQGKKQLTDVTFPTGKTKSTSIDIYSRTYRSPSKMDSKTKADFGEGEAYSRTNYNYSDPSMMASSAIIGLIGIIIAYFVGIPLGIFMARFKNTIFDNMSTLTLNFLLALPSVALIYVIRYVFSSLFGLPDVFPTLGASNPLSYVLPSLILGIFSIPSMAIWMRRYLIDQQLSDYVRFARAKGLTEKEIMNKHVFKNAMVPVVVGIPSSIVGVIVGATLTETIFAYPGMGKMLIDAIKASNNTMVVGLSFIFAVLAIFGLLAGDVLMTIVDPRIKLDTKGGK